MSNQRSSDPPTVPEFPQLCRYLAECSPQPMVAVEGATHIVRYVNPAFRGLVGKGDQHLIGRRFDLAVPEGMANGCAALLTRVFATGQPELLAEQEHSPRDTNPDANPAVPHTHWSYLAWAILAPSADPTLPEAPVGVMIQVTEASEIAGFRNQASAINERLLLSSLRLHDLIEKSNELNAQLRISEANERAARVAAQAAENSKDVFLATFSHELRTPLSAILGWVAILRTPATPGATLDAEMLEGLDVIERNARAQSTLIEDVLDVARVVSGKFHLDRLPCDLAAITRAALQAVRPAAEAKGVELCSSAPAGTTAPRLIRLVADSSRVNQALLNLLTNAIKFTPPGGRVSTVLESDNQAARVIITDTGNGIPADLLPLVFDRFKQAEEGASRSLGGLGLGLTIVRHIAELHGGRVTAQSEGTGRGSTFVLELPLRPGAIHTPHTPTDPLPQAILTGFCILVVDHDPDARMLTCRLLERAGATVVTAETAQLGFERAFDHPPPDVLISDLAMPIADGYTLIKRIRAAEQGSARHLPAIALTNLVGAQHRSRVIKAGFQSHMAKPADSRALIALVASLAYAGPDLVEG